MRDINSSTLKGIIGERIAVHYLCGIKYHIVKNNFRCRYGEVDIIATRLNDICFIEVKAWNTFAYEEIAQSVNKKKQRRIIYTARYFLHRSSRFSGYIPFFGLVFINMRTITCRYIKSAFEEERGWLGQRD